MALLPSAQRRPARLITAITTAAATGTATALGFAQINIEALDAVSGGDLSGLSPPAKPPVLKQPHGENISSVGFGAGSFF
jgi:hypothetical protein